jgi:hypothetical protein
MFANVINSSGLSSFTCNKTTFMNVLFNGDFRFKREEKVAERLDVLSGRWGGYSGFN